MMSCQADKGAIVTLKVAQSQLADENKRLKTELGQASNEIKNNCVRVSDVQIFLLWVKNIFILVFSNRNYRNSIVLYLSSFYRKKR